MTSTDDHARAEARLAVAHFQRRPLKGHNYSTETIFETVRSHMPPDIQSHVLVSPFHSRGILPRIRATAWARKHQHAINHIAGDIHYLALGMDGGRTVLTVLDCVFLTHPSRLRRLVLEWLWYRLPIQRVAAVTVISAFTRDQLLEVVPVPSEKVHVIPACISDDFIAAGPPPTRARPTILQVGTPPNKNIERLAAALEGLDCELHVVGVLSASQEAALTRHRVKVTSSANMSRPGLQQAYENASLVTFCSTYEGFGMPIVEAQRVGRPVVTSNVASMPEVAGDGACLVNPFDPASIRSGIDRVLTDDAYRNRLVELGRANARRFDSARVAAQYAALYRAVHGRA